MMLRGRRDIKPLLVRFGVVVALSFAGFLFSRLRIRRINTNRPRILPPSDRRREVNSGKNTLRKGERHASSAASDSSHSSVKSAEEIHIQRTSDENSIGGLSPSSRHNGDKYILPEFNNLVREFDFAATTRELSFRKDAETPMSDIGTPTAFRTAEKDEYEYEQEIEHLKNVVRTLRERERNVEVQLLEYYGLKEQETTVLELQNQLKISNAEAKLFTLKIESLQEDKQILEAQVVKQENIASELDAAKSKIKLLKKKLKHVAEQNREQLLNLQKRVTRLQEHELNPAANQDIQLNLKRLKVLESEAEELRKSNKRLQIENSDLARRLDSTQILANSVLEDHHEAEGLKEVSYFLRQENKEFQKEIERLQADRCADVEELVYLRWLNACLRYELRNYKAPPGKTAARDLSRSLSPRSERKAKQLILEYANTDGMEERAVSVRDPEFDEWSSTQTSHVADAGHFDDGCVDNSPNTRTINSSRKNKILSKFRKLIRGKGRRPYGQPSSSAGKHDSPEDIDIRSHSPSTGNETASEQLSVSDKSPTTPQVPSRNSLDVQRLRSLNMEDVKDVNSVQRKSDEGSSYPHKSFILGHDDDHDQVLDSQLDQDSGIPDLVKFAEVLQNNRSPNGKYRRS